MTGSNSVWYQIRDFLFLLKFRLTTLKLYKLSAYASLNLSKSESNSLASRFECCYTFAYNLGVSIHWKKLHVECWDTLIDKIEKRLQRWKSKLLSIEGRVTLLNSVISAISLYWIAIYKIPTKVWLHIDMLRRRFLWYGGSSIRKMISLVDWQVVCARKDQGGLGLLNLNTINIALLVKWWYRFSDPAVTGKWKSILLSEYGRHGYHPRLSAFWSAVFKVKFVVDPGWM